MQPPSQSGAPPRYLLDGATPSTGGKWVAHDQVARTWFPEVELEDAPVAIARADRDYEVELQVADPSGAIQRTYYRGYAFPEE